MSWRSTPESAMAAVAASTAISRKLASSFPNLVSAAPTTTMSRIRIESIGQVATLHCKRGADAPAARHSAANHRPRAGQAPLWATHRQHAGAAGYHHHGGEAVQLGALLVAVADELRPRLLRHRDDGDGRRPERPGPLRDHLPRHTAPGRLHDRGRHGLQEDGPYPAHPL